MKITNLELQGQFIVALGELAITKTNTKVAYNAAKTIKSANAAIEVFNAAKKALVETRCVMDANGKPKTENVTVTDALGKESVQNHYVFPTPEVKAEVESLIGQLSNQEIDLDVFSVTLDELGSVEITPLMMMGLKDFIKES